MCLTDYVGALMLGVARLLASACTADLSTRQSVAQAQRAEETDEKDPQCWRAAELLAGITWGPARMIAQRTCTLTICQGR